MAPAAMLGEWTSPRLAYRAAYGGAPEQVVPASDFCRASFAVPLSFASNARQLRLGRPRRRLGGVLSYLVVIGGGLACSSSALRRRVDRLHSSLVGAHPAGDGSTEHCRVSTVGAHGVGDVAGAVSQRPFGGDAQGGAYLNGVLVGTQVREGPVVLVLLLVDERLDRRPRPLLRGVRRS